MYLARFADDVAGFVSGALQWPCGGGAVMPAAWRQRLLAPSPIDISLRLDTIAKPATATLLLTCNAAREAELAAACRQLCDDGPPQLETPRDAAAFDAVAGRLPPSQLRVNHQGYHHGGRDVASNFQLYRTALQRLPAAPGVYQASLCLHRPDKELRRQVLHQLAWLDVEQPFNTAVRGVQAELLRRLLAPAWQSAEFLALADDGDRGRWLAGINRAFQDAVVMGFPNAPVEAGRFDDWMITGRHPFREEPPPSLISRAATLITQREAQFLCSAKLSAPAASRPDRAPEVFVSYASPDFPHATTICRELEAQDVPCWIAPRDINSGVLSYPAAIAQAISRVRAVVVLLSDSANQSVHIPRELDLALQRRLSIIPLRRQEIEPAGQLTYLLSTCQWLDAFDRPLEQAVRELLQRLRHIPGSHGN